MTGPKGTTPGPWKVNKYGSIGVGIRGHEPIVASVEPLYGSDAQYGDHYANARLIAAAPELYEALATLVVLCLPYREEWLSDQAFAEMQKAHQTASAALAKARGEDK
jgi:hypothetical protein